MFIDIIIVKNQKKKKEGKVKWKISHTKKLTLGKDIT